MAPGDRILVDRLTADAGTEISLDRVLLVADGDDLKVGSPAVEGVTVTARILRNTRGPKIDVLRYKSKKRVRVHRGARADLTAIEILEIGGKGRPAQADPPARKAAAKPRRDPATEPETQAQEPEVKAEAKSEVKSGTATTRPRPAQSEDDQPKPKAKAIEHESEDEGEGDASKAKPKSQAKSQEEKHDGS